MTDSNRNAGSGPVGELDWLTAIRIFAATWVVFHHFSLWPFPAGNPLAGMDANLVRHGDLGVTFFFTLSGFILVHVYGKKDKIRLRPFLVARAARIYPVHFLALLLSIPVLIAQFHEHMARYGTTWGILRMGIKSAMVATLTQAWAPSSALAWNGVSWSLSAEAFFYLMLPFLLPWMKRRGARGLAFLLVGWIALDGLRFAGSVLWPQPAWGFTPLLRFPDFATGMALRMLMDRGFRLPFWSSVPFAACFVALQCTEAGGSLGKIASMLGTHVLIALLVVSLAVPRRTPSPSPWMRPFILAGQVSYSVYLLQFPAMWIWIRLRPGWTNADSGQFLLFLFGLSAIAYFAVENPARNRIRALFSKPSD